MGHRRLSTIATIVAPSAVSGAHFRENSGRRSRSRRAFHRQQPCQGAPLGGCFKKGEFAEAIGRSRGGRTSKIPALADDRGSPVAFALTPGNVADITMAARLLADMSYGERLRSLPVERLTVSCRHVCPERTLHHAGRNAFDADRREFHRKARISPSIAALAPDQPAWGRRPARPEVKTIEPPGRDTAAAVFGGHICAPIAETKKSARYAISDSRAYKRKISSAERNGRRHKNWQERFTLPV